MNPQMPSTELQEAIGLHQQGRFEEAEVRYRQILESTEDVTAYLNFSTLLLQTGRNDEALEVVCKAYDLAPEMAEVLVVHTQVSAMCGLGNEALKSALKLKELQPWSAEAFYHVGRANTSLGKHQSAKDAFDEAAKLSPQFVEAHLGLADVYGLTGDFEKALESFSNALRLKPDFLPALIGKGMVLHKLNRVPEAEKLYNQAYSLAPNNPQVLTLMGNMNRDMGNTVEANKFYAKALEIDPNNEVAKDNQASLSHADISNWHIYMLADNARNTAYAKAIAKVVKPGDHVLDIGAGSGLLSLMAAKAGAEKVSAFEMIPDLAEVAAQVVKDNGYENVIEIVNERTTTAEIGKQLPKKANVLVSEILDCGLIGEGVLPSHRHALEHLITDDCKVVPAAATVRGVLIESTAFDAINPLDEIQGFDLSAFEKFREKNIYTRVELKTLPHRALSDVIDIKTFDFKNVIQPYDNAFPKVTEIDFPISEDGHVTAVVFWFDLHLDDEISASTGPDGEMYHWGQASYFLPDRRQVSTGEKLTVKLLQSDTRLRFSY